MELGSKAPEQLPAGLVPLNGIPFQAGEGQGPAGQSPHGQIKGRLGPVPFNLHGAGPVLLVPGNLPAIFHGSHHNSKGSEGFQGHVHIGGGLQGGGEGQAAVPVQQGQGVQQAGDKLGADIARQGVVPGLELFPDGKGQAALCFAGDTVGGQAVQVAPDGALGQPSAAGEHRLHAQGRGNGNTEPQGGAGFPAVDFPQAGSFPGVGAVYSEGPGGGIIGNLCAHGGDGLHGGQHILTGVNGRKGADAPGQGRTEDGPMGGAFGRGHGDGSAQTGRGIGDGIHWQDSFRGKR